MIDVRVAQSIEEVAAVAAAFRVSWDEAPADSMPTGMLRAMSAHTCLLLGAWEDSVCVGGMLGWWALNEAGKPSMRLVKLGVVASHRGQGVATMLRERAGALVGTLLDTTDSQP